MAKQRLADVQCRRLTFEPGGALLVKLNHTPTPEEARKIRRSVEKFARCGSGGVEVLLVDTTKMTVEYLTPEQRANLVILPRDLTPQP